jgi:Mg2+ and Co2+ transporter CorA
MLLVAAAGLVLLGAFTGYVVAQQSAKAETRAMAEQVEQIQARIQLIAQDIGRRADSDAAYYKDLNKLNNQLVDMSDQLMPMFKITEKMLENRDLAGDGAINRDLVGMRQQLGHIATDINNTIQYMEHMSYQMSKLSPSS